MAKRIIVGNCEGYRRQQQETFYSLPLDYIICTCEQRTSKMQAQRSKYKKNKVRYEECGCSVCTSQEIKEDD